MKITLGMWLCLFAVSSAFPSAYGESSKPDFSGTWHYGTLTPLERPDELGDKTHFTAEEAIEFARNFDANFRARVEQSVGEDKFVGADLWLDFGEAVEPDLRTSLITDPPNGKIPERTKQAQARREAFELRRSSFSGPEVLRTAERCIVGAVPIVRAPDNNYVSIVQTNDHLMMVREFAYSTRIVPLDSRPLPPGSIKLWNGASTGYWEDDVLVVVTKNFRDDNSPFGGGEHMVLTERFSLIGPDLISYEFVVDDPQSFSTPWVARSTLHRSDKRRYEYACHEGNLRSMQGILKGSRILEKENEASAR